MLLVFALGPGLFPINGRAATAQVSVGDDFFSPQTSNINQKDSVMWTWIGSIDHSSSSDTGLWDSGIMGNGSAFTFQFNTAGSFPYHCNVHPFQKGTINVTAAASTPPTISITSPTNNSIFAAPANFTLTATASATGATVTQVQFFQGTASLGSVASSPYQVNITNLGTGNYTFSAIVTDSNSAKGTNSASIQVSAATPLVLSGAQFISPASFQFSYATDTGIRYTVDRTLDFSAWLALQTNTASGPSATFTDTNVSTNRSFYRVRRLANP